MEFKSQAKGGTHYVAANQAAVAGAVVSNGVVELTQRSLGLDTIDYNEPQFFSLTVHHISALLCALARCRRRAIYLSGGRAINALPERFGQRTSGSARGKEYSRLGSGKITTRDLQTT